MKGESEGSQEALSFQGRVFELQIKLPTRYESTGCDLYEKELENHQGFVLEGESQSFSFKKAYPLKALRALSYF